jgi:prepilin-type N-terminal cleavage/methylation domain-containing protein
LVDAETECLMKPPYLKFANQRRVRRLPKPRRRGFTLIEILVVIVVIAILASLVAPNVFRHVGTAKDATARAQIEMLGAALDAYRLDNGRYPTTEQGLAAPGRSETSNDSDSPLFDEPTAHFSRSAAVILESADTRQSPL